MLAFRALTAAASSLRINPLYNPLGTLLKSQIFIFLQEFSSLTHTSTREHHFICFALLNLTIHQGHILREITHFGSNDTEVLAD